MILAHTITIHKSQSSTLEYMKGEGNQTTQSGKGKVPINQGQFYTLLSHAKCCDKIRLLNFEVDHIKFIEPALVKMNRMTAESLFLWQHPLLKIEDRKSIYLLNIRSWKNIGHALSYKLYLGYYNVICFAETHFKHKRVNCVEGWATIHKFT